MVSATTIQRDSPKTKFQESTLQGFLMGKAAVGAGIVCQISSSLREGLGGSSFYRQQCLNPTRFATSSSTKEIRARRLVDSGGVEDCKLEDENLSSVA